MSHPANDKLSEAMDTIAHKFVKELRSAVSEQITLSIEKEILSQIEKVNIISCKTSASEKTSSLHVASSLTNDTRNNVQDDQISSHSNEHSSTDKESASVDIDDAKKEKKKKKKRKRHADGEETMNRFSCKQQ